MPTRPRRRPRAGEPDRGEQPAEEEADPRHRGRRRDSSKPATRAWSAADASWTAVMTATHCTPLPAPPMTLAAHATTSPARRPSRVPDADGGRREPRAARSEPLRAGG